MTREELRTCIIDAGFSAPQADILIKIQVELRGDVLDLIRTHKATYTSEDNEDWVSRKIQEASMTTLSSLETDLRRMWGVDD